MPPRSDGLQDVEDTNGDGGRTDEIVVDVFGLGHGDDVKGVMMGKPFVEIFLNLFVNCPGEDLDPVHVLNLMGGAGSTVGCHGEGIAEVAPDLGGVQLRAFLAKRTMPRAKNEMLFNDVLAIRTQGVFVIDGFVVVIRRVRLVFGEPGACFHIGWGWEVK
jgi:hypothetical protein